MSSLGGILNSVVSPITEAVTGSSSGTSLQDFLSKFSSSDGVWAKTLDPFATFDVSIKFHPSFYEPDPKENSSDQNKDWKSKLGDAWESTKNNALNSAKGAVKSLANNLTGGLLGSIMNSRVDIMTKHDENPDAQFGDTTFMEYLAAANLIAGEPDWVGENAGEAVKPLELQLGPYCQEIILPNIEIPQGGSSVNALGEFPINGTIVKTDSNLIVLKILNTKVPLHERIFYPWMREVTLPFWAYDQQPYTTATVTVDFTKHADIKYVFCGCRPQKINMMQATQEKSSPNFKRDVSLIFDYMFVKSDLKNSESLTQKLLSTGGALLNSGAKMLNF